MRRMTTLVLAVLTLCGNGLCQWDSAVFSSYHSGKRYDFSITAEQLAKTPPWAEGEPNPPLSPGRAKEIARDYLSTLFEDASEWHLSEVALRPVAQRWVYLVEFSEPMPQGAFEHLSSPFKLVVLMDAVAVPATISAWKPGD